MAGPPRTVSHNPPVQCAEPRLQFLQKSTGRHETKEKPSLGPTLGPTLRSELPRSDPIRSELIRSLAKERCQQVTENTVNYSLFKRLLDGGAGGEPLPARARHVRLHR